MRKRRNTNIKSSDIGIYCSFSSTCSSTSRCPKNSQSHKEPHLTPLSANTRPNPGICRNKSFKGLRISSIFSAQQEEKAKVSLLPQVFPGTNHLQVLKYSQGKERNKTSVFNNPGKCESSFQKLFYTWTHK